MLKVKLTKGVVAEWLTRGIANPVPSGAEVRILSTSIFSVLHYPDSNSKQLFN